LAWLQLKPGPATIRKFLHRLFGSRSTGYTREAV